MLDLSLLGPERIRPLKRREYHRLIELGVFDEDERVELLHGFLVEMSPVGPPHSGIVQALTRLVVPALLGRAAVRIQSPYAASEGSEPEPDVAVVPEGDYMAEHPSQAYLIIEVADSSVSKDRHIKAALYAAGGVREYWIVNILERRVECYRDPRDGRFQRAFQAGPGETLAIEAFPDVVLSVESFLPR